jgi:uncharacterized glyoxalase superfamily protein PhnB
MASGPTTIPFLRYEDAPAAIAFLKAAFGCEEKLVVPGEGGRIEHAELTFGNGMVMVGSMRDDGDDDIRLRSPKELGGSNQGIYVVVDDPDALHERARSAGAEIQRELTDQDYGSREFIARDPEGNIWSFGTYDPFAPAG